MAVSNAATRPGDENGPKEEIVFSSRDGFVWASWPQTNATIRLGRHDLVAAMMQDFLAQDSLGRRLATNLDPGD